MGINIKNSSLKKAFTLSETLVTIAIIGVVMALMLRAINRVNPDADKVQFVKTYHALETAIVETINDPENYDQAFYNDAEIEAANTAGTELNIDFRYRPYSTAKVTYLDSSGTEHTKGVNSATGAGTRIGQEEAVCYFIADKLNTVGGVSCENNSTANMRLSTGVCLYNAYGVNAQGSVDIVINPNCDGASNGYVVRVFKDGKMTVPNAVTGYSKQATAFGWMQNQTQVN